MTYIPQVNSGDTGATPGAVHGTDEGGVLAVMSHRPVLNKEATEVEGRPIYEAKPWIKIVVPGDNKNIIQREVNEADKQRWPHVWEALEQRQAGVANGTPIEEFKMLTAVQVATLRHMGILTVEMLAGVADSKLSMQLPRDLRDRARQFLAGTSETEKELRVENRELKGQVQALMARVETLARDLQRLGGTTDEEPGTGLVSLDEPKRRKPRARKNGARD